jgi:hypothetical protein
VEVEVDLIQQDILVVVEQLVDIEILTLLNHQVEVDLQNQV